MLTTDPTKVTKEELIKYVKNWMSIEKEIKELQREMKIRRDKKKQLSLNLVAIMKTNEIECLDINDGKLIYTHSKVKNTINKNYLLGVLGKYFENDPDVEIDLISDFILENRETDKVREGIKCKFNKK